MGPWNGIQSLVVTNKLFRSSDIRAATWLISTPNKAEKEGKCSELQTDGEDQSTKKARQNGRAERRRLQAQLRERAQIELEHVRAARQQVHNIDIFPYKACGRGTSSNSANNCSRSRKMPLAGSTDVSKVRGFSRGFTGSLACFPGGNDELTEDSEIQVTPEPTNKQRVPALHIIPPANCDQEDTVPLVRELAAPEQVRPAAVLPEEEEGVESGTTTHASEQDVTATAVHEPNLLTSRAQVVMVQEEEVAKARAVASAVPKKSFAAIVKQLLTFRIFSPTAAAALPAVIENIAEVEARSPRTSACADPPVTSARGPSAAAVAKTLRQNISRCHPMCHTVRSILKSFPTTDSSSSSSSEDDESNLPVYRTLSVQRRSCMRRRKPFRFFRVAKPRVYWASNADEAVYIEYVAPVASLFPPETVEVRPPSVDQPYKQFRLVSKEGAAARAAAAAKAAAEGDPERQAAADAAAVAAATLAREAAQEAAEAAASEAKATAEEEARALALLRKVAAALADAEGSTLQAKARAGLLSREEFLRWQRRGEENLCESSPL